MIDSKNIYIVSKLNRGSKSNKTYDTITCNTILTYIIYKKINMHLSYFYANRMEIKHCNSNK